MSEVRRADAAMYARVFEGHHEGVLILEDLTRRFFDVKVFVEGGPEAARKTDFNLGAREVVRHILLQLSQVAQPDPNEESAG